jgi:ABC-type nitrate/sulfonate/bicarbonate transport system permease component
MNDDPKTTPGKKSAERLAPTARPAQPPAAVIPEAPPWYVTLRQQPPAWLSIVLGVSCLLLIWLVWYLFTAGDTPDQRAISPSKLPSPYEVFSAFSALVARNLGGSIIATLMRVLIGFFWATLVGVGFGVFAASFRAFNAFVNPIVLFGRSLPLAALIPLTILWFGIEEGQKEMFIFLASVPFVFSDTVKAVSLVPQRYVETAQTLGASRFQIIRKVLFPLALPDIVTGLRFLFGLALGYIMLAEVINAGEGLGFLINQGERLGKADQNYLLLMVIGALAFVIDLLIRFMQRSAFPYRRDL